MTRLAHAVTYAAATVAWACSVVVGGLTAQASAAERWAVVIGIGALLEGLQALPIAIGTAS